MTTEIENLKRGQKIANELAFYGWNEFARSLTDFWNERKFLTPKQMDAAERMLEKAKAKQWDKDFKAPLRIEQHWEGEEVSPVPDSVSYVPEEEPF